MGKSESECLFSLLKQKNNHKHKNTIQMMYNIALHWSLYKENCIGVCTDGAGAIIGKRAGFVAKVKEHATPERVTFTHCMIHRKALAAKHMSFDLDRHCSSRCCQNNQLY